MNDATQTVIVNTRHDERYIAWLADAGYIHDSGCRECREEGSGTWVTYLSASHVAALAESAARDESAAYSENDQRNERPADTDEIKEVTAARGLGASVDQIARVRAILEERNTALNRASDLQRQVNTLQSEEIMGDDPRLLQFWIKAAREATIAGYCPEYDRIAESAGGPSRDELSENGHLSSNYAVVVRVVRFVEVEVEASDSDDARDEAVSLVQNNGSENYSESDDYQGEVLAWRTNLSE